MPWPSARRAVTITGWVLAAGGLDFEPTGELDAFDVLVYATGGDEADT